jgi:hypothetical protein
MNPWVGTQFSWVGGSTQFSWVLDFYDIFYENQK